MIVHYSRPETLLSDLRDELFKITLSFSKHTLDAIADMADIPVSDELTWWRSSMCLGKCSNKGQLLKSYSCIEVNWENIGNYFLSRLFFSPLKVPALQKHITAGHERATVCPYVPYQI